VLPLPGDRKSQAFGQLETFSYALADGSGALDVSTTRLETMLGDVAVAVHPTDERHAGKIGTRRSD
jgi:valyl-tRNA synthetase